MTLLAIITWLARWTALSIALLTAFGWLNLRHSHPTHNPARQDGEGHREGRVYQHGEAN